MVERLLRLFRVHHEEARPVLLLGFVLLVNALSVQLSSIVSVSGFLATAGPNQMLLIWIVDMVLIIVAASLQSLAVDRFDRALLIGWMSFAYAFAYAALRLMFALPIAGWVNYSCLYLLTDQQWLFFPMVVWVFASDVFDPAQVKRLFPLMGGLGIVGRLAGIVVAIFAPDLFAALRVSAAEVLSLNVIVYLLAFLAVAAGLRHFKARQTSPQRAGVRETIMEGWGFIKEVASFRYLVIALLALAVCDTIIEFRFLVLSDAAFGDQFQTFYGLFRLGVTLLSLLIQVFVTSRLIDKLTMKNAFFLLPASALVGMLMLIGWPGLAAGAIGVMGLVKVVDGTAYESNRKAFQSLVPEERRGRVSMFMDSYLLAAGGIIGSVIVGAVVWGGLAARWALYPFIYLGIGLAAALVAVWAVFNMRRKYDSSLLNWRLKRRQRGASVLDKLQF